VVGWFESVQDLFPMVGAWRLVSVEVAGTIETTLKLRVAMKLLQVDAFNFVYDTQSLKVFQLVMVMFFLWW
jgi:hypothetical protein